MAAAYAAVASLMNTMENIQFNHTRLFNSSFDNQQFQSLHEIVVFFEQFLEESHQQEEALESQIAAVAHVAEGVLESHVVDQILARSTAKISRSRSSSFLDLQKVIKDMDSVKEKVMEVTKWKETTAYNILQQPTLPMPDTSSKLSSTGKSSMVGFDVNSIRLRDMLTGEPSTRQIITITGMGGIGKTTLAKNVYENLAIVRHFDIHGWAVVSQQNSARDILVELLSCLAKREKSEMDGKTEEELGLMVHQCLFHRRYLIVLDDVWSIETWDKIKFRFQDNNNSSRIVVTTRESSVANNLGPLNFVMNFLDEDQSWALFCEKTFGQQDHCPPELEEIGKQIVKKCKGLPLSIVVIGGLLQKSNKSQESWKIVANDINSILLNSTNDEINCMNILSLSYTHLPAHLKPCFLHLGVFPEDHEICVSRLIKYWVAEGFLKPNKPQSLEEVAEGCFKNLVDRNLILVHRLGSSGKIKSCKIHDVLRDLCLRVCEKEKVICFTRVIGDHLLEMDRGRRVVFSERILEEEYHPDVFHALHLGSLANYLVKLRMSMDYMRDHFRPIFQQVRHINITYENIFNLSYVSLFCNLQTVVITGGYQDFVAPSEIWVARQLRHLKLEAKLGRIFVPDPPPPPSEHDQQDDVLVNLQTLGGVVNLNLSEEVCRRIPNIQKLDMRCDCRDEVEGSMSSYHSLCNLGRLNKLESLRLQFHIGMPYDMNLFKNITFPSSLKKLSLKDCWAKWDELTIIGSLPNLEVLKLFDGALKEDEWNPIEGGFLRLKFLQIENCDLRTWKADNSPFPVLETLFLSDLEELEEIPLSFGDISTLKHIHVEECSESAAVSAMKILEEQASFGNDGLQLRLKFLSRSELERFKEEVEPETLETYQSQFQATYFWEH